MRIEIKDIKKDTVFWERDQSFTAIEDGYFSGVVDIDKTEYDQYRVQGKCNKTGDIVNFLVTEGHGHYGPSLYTENMYKDMFSIKNVLGDKFKEKEPDKSFVDNYIEGVKLIEKSLKNDETYYPTKLIWTTEQE